MAVNWPQNDRRARGGSDAWDDGLAGQIMLADYFEIGALAEITAIAGFTANYISRAKASSIISALSRKDIAIASFAMTQSTVSAGAGYSVSVIPQSTAGLPIGALSLDTASNSALSTVNSAIYVNAANSVAVVGASTAGVLIEIGAAGLCTVSHRGLSIGVLAVSGAGSYNVGVTGTALAEIQGEIALSDKRHIATYSPSRVNSPYTLIRVVAQTVQSRTLPSY